MKKIIDQSEFLQNFDKDKNTILKSAQSQATDVLTKRFVEIAINQYRVHFNPLGLIDDTVQQIMDYDFQNTIELNGLYENLSVAYRYKYGDNQLEIIWDGRSHEQKYVDDWSATFDEWVHGLTENPSMIKGILQLTVFNEEKRNLSFVRNALKGFINDYFEIKILMRNGIKRVVLKERKLKKAS